MTEITRFVVVTFLHLKRPCKDGTIVIATSGTINAI